MSRHSARVSTLVLQQQGTHTTHGPELGNKIHELSRATHGARRKLRDLDERFQAATLSKHTQIPITYLTKTCSATPAWDTNYDRAHIDQYKHHNPRAGNTGSSTRRSVADNKDVEIELLSNFVLK